MGRWFQLASLPWGQSKMIAPPPTKLPEQREAAPTVAETPTLRAERMLTLLWSPLQFLFWELIVPVGVFTLAFLPRWSLAKSLDLVTDESVYIPEGVREFTMLQHGDLTSSLWLKNYEAPPLAKLFVAVGSQWGAHVWPLNGWLLGARLPGVILSSVFLVVAYWLARPIFGRFPATLGALALALSPWVAYFAAIAYLDSYMVAFATVAILLSWYAARRPALLPVVALLLGLGFSAKYTGAFASIPVILYLAYYYVVVERRLIRRRDGAAGPTRRGLPWQFWLIPPIVLATIYFTDPAIWISPISRLWNSMLFELDHAINGHGVFWNGQVWEHVPPGEAVYILLAKMSLFILVPAFLALPWAAWRVYSSLRAPTALSDRAAFALCWFGGLLPAFGLLTIVVGTHYMLPLAPAVAFTGAWALVRSCEWLAPRLTAGVIDWRRQRDDVALAVASAPPLDAAPEPPPPTTDDAPSGATQPTAPRWAGRLRVDGALAVISVGLGAVLANLTSGPATRVGDGATAGRYARSVGAAGGQRSRAAVRRTLAAQTVALALLAIVTLALTYPPAHGLATVPQAEGYTSEWLSGENQSLQVAYPGYADALNWIVAHTHGRTSVTLIGTPGALDIWIGHRQNLYPERIRLAVGIVCAKGSTDPCPPRPNTTYVIWPMHLVQRQAIYPMPPNWQAHVVATIGGGGTTYCYILKM